MTPEERLTELEVKFAFLEEHVARQDRVILEQRTLLEKQTAELARLREELIGEGMDVREQDERPPHY